MRFNNLQVLRLVAALGVVVYHLGLSAAQHGVDAEGGPVPWLKMPWVASFFVPLFFALSGFVLTHALYHCPPGRWAALRVARLYPGYWVAALAVGAVVGLGLWPGGYLVTPKPTWATVLLVPESHFEPGRHMLFVEWTMVYEVLLSASLLGVWLVAGPRRLPYVAAAWVAVVAIKAGVKPGHGSLLHPVWKSVAFSIYTAPFWLGVVAYSLRDRGRRWRWAALSGVVLLNALSGWVGLEAERHGRIIGGGFDLHIGLRAVAAALCVWFAVNVRDVSDRNPLAAGGGLSYGLYLVHFPAMEFAFGVMAVTGVLYGTGAGIVVAGVWAIGLGFLFGRFELALYGRAKRLVNAAGPRWGRVAKAVGRRTPFSLRSRAGRR